MLFGFFSNDTSTPEIYTYGHTLSLHYALPFSVGEQLEGEHVDLFLRLLALADHVAAVVVGEARLDAVAGVVGQRQRDGAGGGDGAVVGEAGAGLGQFFDQFRGHGGDLLHVAAVARVQLLALDLLAHRSEEHTSELQSLMRISYAV